MFFAFSFCLLQHGAAECVSLVKIFPGDEATSVRKNPMTIKFSFDFIKWNVNSNRSKNVFSSHSVLFKINGKERLRFFKNVFSLLLQNYTI